MEASGNDIEELAVATRLLNAAKFFNHIYIPLLCIFGALGNCLSVSVFCRPSSHRSLSASLYLSAVAISDTGFLLNLIAVWLEGMGVPVITSPVTCPLAMYLGQVTCFLSVWFIVAFTIERFFAVCYPLTRPTVCTVARAKKVIAILTIVALAGFSYVWVIATVVRFPVEQEASTIVSTECADNRNLTSDSCNQEIGFFDNIYLQNDTDLNGTASVPEGLRSPVKFMSFCSVRQEHLYFSSIASHIDSVFTLILPFAIITYLNIRIAACVWRFRVQRENMVAASRSRLSEDNDFEAYHHSRGPVSFVYRAKQPQYHCSNDGSMYKSNSQVLTVHPHHAFRDHKNHLEYEPSQSRSTNSNNSTNNLPYCSEIPKNRTVPIDSRRRRVRKVGAHGSGYAKVEVRVTKTLLLVSTVFLVLNLPSHAIRAATFLQFFWKIDIRPDALFAAQQWANVLFNMNFSVNFLLYCVSGRNFRASVKRIFFRRSRLRRHPKSKIVGSLLLINQESQFLK